MATIVDYEKELAGKTCKFHDAPVDLGSSQIVNYPHTGGYPVDNYRANQWMYVVCPDCSHQWSLDKLGIASKKKTPKKK